ncbi:AraC family transcriptional regulator [Nocardia stercoris]|uniref:AraC family transcriptional regulator n=1 Tax=Nocardia stercoris TaxID=2483361 RepID=UPI001F3AD550|nr:helix-turn-helix domain-containing protein [Nocardia stercoris]
MTQADDRSKAAAAQPIRVPPEVAKGVLNPVEQARHRTLSRLPAGPDVERFVDWYWIVRWDLRGRPAYVAEVLPFPAVHLTFERSHTRTGGFVTGVVTRKFSRELAGEGETFGVKFRPGGFGAFTGVDVGALRDRVLPLAEILPEAADLTDRVLAADTDVQRRELVEARLAGPARAAADDEAYRSVLSVVAAMADDRDLTRVDQVTERFGIPIRTLQRLFRRYVGVGPKWVLRRYRLLDGAQLLAAGRTADLATLALELGYFDQAHFSREFAREIGTAPLEYARTAESAASGSAGGSASSAL